MLLYFNMHQKSYWSFSSEFKRQHLFIVRFRPALSSGSVRPMQTFINSAGQREKWPNISCHCIPHITPKFDVLYQSQTWITVWNKITSDFVNKGKNKWRRGILLSLRNSLTVCCYMGYTDWPQRVNRSGSVLNNAVTACLIRLETDYIAISFWFVL